MVARGWGGGGERGRRELLSGWRASAVQDETQIESRCTTASICLKLLSCTCENSTMVNFYVFFTIIRKMITLDAVGVIWLWGRKEGTPRARWKTTVKKQPCEMRVAWTVADGEEGTDSKSSINNIGRYVGYGDREKGRSKTDSQVCVFKQLGRQCWHSLRKNPGRGRGQQEGPTKNSGLDLLMTAVGLLSGDIWEVTGSDSGRLCQFGIERYETRGACLDTQRERKDESPEPGPPAKGTCRVLAE